jgi:hypothetical protein
MGLTTLRDQLYSVLKARLAPFPDPLYRAASWHDRCDGYHAPLASRTARGRYRLG